MEASLNGFNFNLSGDLSEKLTALILTLDIEKINFFMDGIRYAKDVRLNFLTDVKADLENSIYTINKNELSLNDLTLGLEGKVEMKDEDIITNLKYYTTNTSFKTLLSLVPAIYMKDFESVKTEGELKLDGTVIGTIAENILPVIKLDIAVNNAMFKYPDLPKQVDHINIGLKVKYDGVFEDSTTVNLNKFHLEIAGNPVDMQMFIKTPMTDMNIDGNLKTNFELVSLADAIPMEDTKLSGKIISDIDIKGNLSSIENEKYEDFKADGSLKMINIDFNSPDVGYDIKVNEMTMLFSPKYVDLKKFEIMVGESDFQLTGKLENFIPYIFEYKTVKGSLNFSSNYINVNQFMTSDSTMEEAVEEADTAAMAVIEVPGNIDFTLKTNLAKVLYDKLEIKDITGLIKVKDGIARMENLSMNTLDGFINMTGEYNTTDMENPFIDYEFAMTGVDISSTVNAFNSIEELAPVSKNAQGKISTSFTLSSFLESDMSPRMNSIISTGNLTSKSIKIDNSKTFSTIGEKLGSDKFNEITLNDVDLDFEIRDGKILVKPFEAKLGSGKAMIGGEQFLDQTINYAINLSMPRSSLGSGANNALNSLTSGAEKKGIVIDQNENMNFDIKVLGTVTDPKVTLDLKSNTKNAVAAVKQKMIDDSKQELQKREAEAKAKANAEAQRIISNAEKQSQQILEQAKSASEKVRKEAYDKADKMEKDAAGMPKFKRELVKVSADKVRKEGDEKADAIMKKAEQESKSIIEKARKEAAEKTQ